MYSCHLALGLSSGTLDPSSGYIGSDSEVLAYHAAHLNDKGRMPRILKLPSVDLYLLVVVEAGIESIL